MNRLAAEILLDLQRGLTYAEAGKRHGVSRQYAYSLALDAGIAKILRRLREKARTAKHPVRREPMYGSAAAARHGLTLQEYRVLKEPIRIYRIQKKSAHQRGITFALTFREWWHIWQASGHWTERGVGKGKFVMARHGDVGPYAVDNVRITTFEQNAREGLELLRLQGKIHSGKLPASS